MTADSRKTPDKSAIAGRKAGRALSVLSPAKRLLALLERPDAREQVRALASVQLHRAIVELGLDDAAELLELAEPEQLREVVDLQVWQRDRVDIDELCDWVHTLARLSDEARQGALRGLDVELLGVLIRRSATIYLAQEDELPPEPVGVFYQTPDRWFVLDFTGEPARIRQTIEIIEALYQIDLEDVRRFLHNLMWELSDDLEENAFRWRSGRLEEMGFSDPVEAQTVYAYLDPAEVGPDERSAAAPRPANPDHVDRLDLERYALPEQGAFWSRALASLSNATMRDRLADATMTLSNKALSADRVSPSDEQQARASMTALLWRLSLGLEQLCDGDVACASTVLEHVALLRIARLGHSLVLDLRRELHELTRLYPLGRRPRSVDLVDTPLRDQLAPLLALRPQFFDAETGRLRPFHERADLACARGWLAQAAAVGKLSPGAPVVEQLPGAATLGDLFRTEVVNRLLERAGALDRAAISRLLERAFVDGALRPEVRAIGDELARAIVGEGDANVRAAAAGYLDRLEQELGQVRADDVELRYITCLLLAR